MRLRILGNRNVRICLAALVGMVSTLVLTAPAPAATEVQAHGIPLCCSVGPESQVS